jgi:broad specificity phosphatase PhoE
LSAVAAGPAAFIDDNETDVLSYLDFPEPHRRKLRSTNPLERLNLNKEVKRRPRRHLPQRSRDHSADRRGAARAKRRVADLHSRNSTSLPDVSIPPGGESFVAVIERVSLAIHRLVETHSGRDIIVVAHGGTIRAALALALDLDPEAALAFTVENCAITRIDRLDGPGMGHGWRVVKVNQPPR